MPVRALTAAVVLGAAATSGCAVAGMAPVVPAGGVRAGALVVVVGARANTPRPEMRGQAATVRDQAGTQGAHFSVVVADGAPFFTRDAQPVDADPGPAGSAAASRSYAQQVDDAVASARAAKPESDLLAALALAADRLIHASGLRTVVVQDSGLSTTGLVDFTQPGMFDADPDQVADSIADADRLPDLRGALVVFEGLGVTVGPQPRLDSIRKAQLRQIWRSVAMRAGASELRFEDDTQTKPPPDGLPPVSIVSLPVPVICSEEGLRLQGRALAFKPGSPDMIDAFAAATALRPVAERMKRDGLIAEVFGTYSAEGDQARRQKLSEERAQAVANRLIALGVPVSQLRVKGLGSAFADYVPDRDSRGKLVPAKAALNRFVTVTFSKAGFDIPCRQDVPQQGSGAQPSTSGSVARRPRR